MVDANTKVSERLSLEIDVLPDALLAPLVRQEARYSGVFRSASGQPFRKPLRERAPLR